MDNSLEKMYCQDDVYVLFGFSRDKVKTEIEQEISKHR